MPFNHNIQLEDYIVGLERELAGSDDKKHKAAVLAELDAVRGSKAVTAPAETRAAAPAAEPMADFGGK